MKRHSLYILYIHCERISLSICLTVERISCATDLKEIIKSEFWYKCNVLISAFVLVSSCIICALILMSLRVLARL